MNNVSALVRQTSLQNKLLSEILRLINALVRPVESIPVKQPVWLDRQSVWEKYHLSTKTLQRREKDGIIPATKIKGKTYYDEEDILEALRKGK